MLGNPKLIVRIRLWLLCDGLCSSLEPVAKNTCSLLARWWLIVLESSKSASEGILETLGFFKPLIMAEAVRYEGIRPDEGLDELQFMASS